MLYDRNMTAETRTRDYFCPLTDRPLLRIEAKKENNDLLPFRSVLFFRTRSILYLISTPCFVSSVVYLQPILNRFAKTSFPPKIIEDRLRALRKRASKKIFYNYEFGYLPSYAFEYLFSLKTQARCQILPILLPIDQSKSNSRLEATSGNLPFFFDFRTDRRVTQTSRHRWSIIEKANDSGNSKTTLIKARGNRADARDEARRRS